MTTEDNLPSKAFQSLTKSDKTDSNRELIKDHLMSGGLAFELTAFQQELLTRWEYTDQMIRENTGKLSRSSMAEMIKNKFCISLATAKSDMTNAEYVFSSSNPLHKAYQIGLHIEFLQKSIRVAAAANDYKAVAMLSKNLLKAFEIYPETTPVEVPKNLIFSFDVEKLADKLMSIGNAESILDEQIEKNRLLDSLSTDITFETDDVE